MKSFLKKLIISIFLIIFLFMSNVFASWNFQDSSVFNAIFINIVNLISAIWFIFPILVWKLISNDLLFGNILGLDSLFWEIWNFSRSIANFVIWFLFIYFIFKYIVSIWEKDLSWIKTYLPKLAFWSIIINASWFIMWLFIDLSTILIAWFGALPLNFYENKNINVTIPTEISTSSQSCDKDKKSCFPWNLNIEIKEWKDISLKELNTYESRISGPLFFMWSSIISINWDNSMKSLMNNAYNIQEQKFKSNGTAIKAIIQLLIMLLFVIPMIILILVSLVRVFWVWIYICFSPLLFLNNVFGWKIWDQKVFSFKNMIWLIFQPVLIVLTFSLWSLFIVSIYSVLSNSWQQNKKYSENLKKTFFLDESGNNFFKFEWLWKLQDTESNSWNLIWWFFSYVFISFMVIFLVWVMIKMAFKSSEVTAWISESAFKFTEDIFKSVRWIPTPYGMASIWGLKKLWWNLSALPNSLVSKQNKRLLEKFDATPDLPKKELEKITNELENSTNNKIIKEKLNESFSILSRYSNKNIENFPNAKQLVESLEKYVNNNYSHIKDWSNLKDRLSVFGDIDRKKDILIQNKNSIIWL